jgi:DNA-binding transcriptional regulator YdaS (Cro superfamily)
MSRTVIDEVFEKAGGRQALRESLGLSKQSMSDWIRHQVVPIKHCPKVHAITGIPLEKLNPAFRVAYHGEEDADLEQSIDPSAKG